MLFTIIKPLRNYKTQQNTILAKEATGDPVAPQGSAGCFSTDQSDFQGGDGIFHFNQLSAV